MKFLLLSTTLLITLSGCADIASLNARQMHTIKLTTTFNPDDARYILEHGNATITGSASITDAHGETISCAGNNVILVPVTDYSTERYQHLFGSNSNGFSSDDIIFHVRFKPDTPEFRKYMKVSTCNYVGEFTFDQVADGEYYLGTNIISEMEGYNTIQGGALAKKISVKNGKNLHIKLR